MKKYLHNKNLLLWNYSGSLGGIATRELMAPLYVSILEYVVLVLTTTIVSSSLFPRIHSNNKYAEPCILFFVEVKPLT